MGDRAAVYGLGCMLLLVGACAQETTVPWAPSDWWDCEFGHRAAITLNNSAPEDLIDFPVLVRLDPARVTYSSLTSTGQDIRFVDAAEAPLEFEVDTWEPDANSLVWVRIPSISANSTGTQLWMYYDNAAASDAQSPASVWADFLAVWHFGLNGTTVTDSTGNGNTGNVSGPVAAIGRIGGGLEFDGLDDFVTVTHSFQDTLTSWSASAWIHIDDRSVDRPLFTRLNGGLYPRVRVRADGGIVVQLRTGAATQSFTSGDVTVGSFHHVAVTFESPGNDAATYLDATLTEAFTFDPGLQTGNNNDLQIGQDTNLNTFFSGVIDELRISRVPRSAAWVSAERRNSADEAGDPFVSFGPEEAAGARCP